MLEKILEKIPGEGYTIYSICRYNRQNGKDYNMDGTDRGLLRAADFVS